MANNGSKCDAYGTQHGTEPIVLPYHDEPLNAAKWLCDVVLRSRHRGKARKDTPLFADEHGSPFKDAAFGGLSKHALAAVVGKHIARSYSARTRGGVYGLYRAYACATRRMRAFKRWVAGSIRTVSRSTRE